MSRRPRMYLPGIPAHVVQRGNNREPSFFSEEDYGYYLDCLKRGLCRYRIKLHAYVLMTNHVHLLMTPEDEQGISRLMALVGKDYVMHINKTYRRSGTLWEGRHKASLIDGEDYLLHCYKYIELNPVRTGMAITPEDYPWSSYFHHAWGGEDALIEDHDLYHALGKTDNERQYNYRELFKVALSDHDLHLIRVSTHYNYLLGNDRFKERIEASLGRGIGYNKRGRPCKKGDILLFKRGCHLVAG